VKHRQAGFKLVKRMLRPDGSTVWVDASITALPAADAQPALHLCMIEDITEKKQTEALIWQQANFDTLTQLPNRRMFHNRLQQAIIKSRRDATRIAFSSPSASETSSAVRPAARKLCLISSSSTAAAWATTLTPARSSMALRAAEAEARTTGRSVSIMSGFPR